MNVREWSKLYFHLETCRLRIQEYSIDDSFVGSMRSDGIAVGKWWSVGNTQLVVLAWQKWSRGARLVIACSYGAVEQE